MLKTIKYKLFANNKKLCYYWILAITECDGTFTDKILVVGQTGCGKTTLIENLGKKECLENLKMLTGSPKSLCQRIEEKRLDPSLLIRQLSFPDDLSDFNYLIEFFSKRNL